MGQNERFLGIDVMEDALCSADLYGGFHPHMKNLKCSGRF